MYSGNEDEKTSCWMLEQACSAGGSAVFPKFEDISRVVGVFEIPPGIVKSLSLNL